MILKPYKTTTQYRDERERAGAAAEQQMAHYLHRRFQWEPEVCVLHQLRIEDADQPEQDGSPGVCQIDHLVVHRWGFFLVESKSVTGTVQVRPDGDGGDEWSRSYRDGQKGMPSPIRQAKRQSEFLRAVLQRHRSQLVGRQAPGLRTIARVVAGTDQRGFRNAPMQLVVAVSDRGRIHRLEDWKEPQRPFRVIVTKADLVTEKLDAELDRHRTGANVLHVRPAGDYGLWSMETEETLRVAEFLAGLHTRSTTESREPTRRHDAAAQRGWMDEVRKQFPNAYRPWSPEDERELCRLRENGWEPGELSEKFGRQPSAIESKLRKLGRG